MKNLTINSRKFELFVKETAEIDQDQRYLEDPLLFMSIASTIFNDLMSFAASDKGQEIISRITDQRDEFCNRVALHDAQVLLNEDVTQLKLALNREKK